MMKIIDPPDPFAKLPELAKRLGVKESTSHGSTVTIRTKDGKCYDLFELMNAFLDKMEGKI